MKQLIAVAVLSTFVSTAHGLEADFHAEVMQWVIEPCMEVAAALGVKSYDRDQIDVGIKREHVAQLMTASRDSAARDLAGKMKASATWEDRRAAYPLMLEICLAQVQRDAQ